MSIPSVLTNEGISQTIIAMASQGYFIKFKRFAVSETKGALDRTRQDGDEMPIWYEALISSAQKIDSNTVQLNCTIPAGATDILTSNVIGPNETREIQELYIYAEDDSSNEFLIGIGQPDPSETYVGSGATTFRIQMVIQNVDISSIFEFKYTQANEISDHNDDPNAHPEIQNVMKKHGQFVHESDRKYVGQEIDQFPDLDNAVIANDMVYWDTVSSTYKQALADGTAAQKAVGLYSDESECVIFGGVVDYTHSFDPFTNLYLSPTNAGEITDEFSQQIIGYALPNNKVFVLPRDFVKLSEISGGGGGAGSFVPELGLPAPIKDILSGLKVLKFDYQDTQEIWFNFKLPKSYISGSKLVLAGGTFYTLNSTAGKVLFRADVTLLKKGNHNLNSLSLIHTSTNVEVDASNPVGLAKEIGLIDLTNADGEIASTLVEADDILLIRVYRDVANESVSCEDNAVLAESSFEPYKVLG